MAANKRVRSLKPAPEMKEAIDLFVRELHLQVDRKTAGRIRLLRPNDLHAPLPFRTARIVHHRYGNDRVTSLQICVPTGKQGWQNVCSLLHRKTGKPHVMFYAARHALEFLCSKDTIDELKLQEIIGNDNRGWLARVESAEMHQIATCCSLCAELMGRRVWR